MLNTKQNKFITAFLKAGQINTACKEAGISKPTYYEWLKIEEFAKELKEQQDFIYNAALVELNNLVNDAVSTYRDLLNSQDESIKFRTASAILDNRLKLVESKEIQERIKALEDSVSS